MHICIVGTGAAGWITANLLKKEQYVKKITIIGSPHIPTIGVGESTTLNFSYFLSTLFENDHNKLTKFLVDIDAAVKYGVFYKNWSEKNFLHAFVGSEKNNLFGYLLGKLSKDKNENHYMMPLYDQILNNNIFVYDSSIQNYSFHFDANKFISTMEKLAKNEPKIYHIKDTVVDAKFDGDKSISNITLSNGTVIEADYYISCVGQRDFNERVFKEEYVEYSDVLLTNKALFCPLEYTNKEKQFHPYTVAKTMKHGWRWITPTWSRIGTGYAFSTNHVSIDEAIHEFQQDIGNTSIEPFVTNFFPRRVKNVFKKNYCSIGMAAGFLEPLDAPGLFMTLIFIEKLKHVFKKSEKLKNANQYCKENYDFWASFILHQYKTCNRQDTDFWIDHKNVYFEVYEKIIKDLTNPVINKNTIYFLNNFIKEPCMFYHTTAGKGLRWNVKHYKSPMLPFKYKICKDKYESKNLNTHYEYFLNLHRKYK